MSISGGLLGLLFLIVFMGPILYLVFKDKKKARRIKQKIQQMADRFNLTDVHPIEIGYIIFLIDKEDRRVVLFNRNEDDNEVVEFDKKLSGSISAHFEDEVIENGNRFTAKITITIKNTNFSKNIIVFDDQYPNQLEGKHLVNKTKSIVHQLQKI